MDMVYEIYGVYEGIPSFNNNNINKNNNNNNYINLPSFKKPVYTGIKWECIEFVRRFFILKKGLTFQNVINSYDMTSIKFFIGIYDKELYPSIFFDKNDNIQNIIPQKYDIILLFDDITGHVGIVTKFENGFLYIVDQNNGEWEKEEYARRINIRSNDIIGFLRVL